MEEIKDIETVKELLETKQYTRLRQKLSEENAADIAVIMEELGEEDLQKIFRILPKNLAADVLPIWRWTASSFLSPACRKRMRQGLSTT